MEQILNILQKEIKELKSKIEYLDGYCYNLENQISSNRSEVSGEISYLERKIDDLDARIFHLE